MADTGGSPVYGGRPGDGSGDDRDRLARELHDGPAQTLTALVWRVQLLERRLESLGLEIEEAREVESLARQAQQDTRHCLERLRTPEYKDG